ncbi:hypothetical protein ACLQ24_26865 [Micromonospora sp. DT4]|uniref:hypothetical protein n=1 Tax=Micromonospora sp. DT4 TaxID=3393438 RepID=UPI003CF8AC82
MAAAKRRAATTSATLWVRRSRSSAAPNRHRVRAASAVARSASTRAVRSPASSSPAVAVAEEARSAAKPA